MKVKYLLPLAGCVLVASAQAQTAAHETLLARFKNGSEPTAKDAVWTSPTMFKVGVVDNKSNRDGYAEYVCGEATALGLKGISVQIVDIVKVKNTGKWVRLGEKRC